MRNENGWAVLTAILVMTAMLGLGLASYAYVDTQQRQTGVERVQESTFNLTEGALTSQTYILARNWPNNAANAFPAACRQSTTSDPRRQCPTPANVAAAFNTADFGGANLVWTTVVNDNGIDATPAVGEAKDFYDPAVVPLQPRYDLNNDGKLWVRAQAIVRGQRRTLVQLVRHDQKVEQLPRSAVTAGRFRTGNNGNKTIVDTDGGTDGVPIASPPGIVQVRCGTTANHGTEGDGCLDFVPDRDQVYPNTAVGGYSGGNALSSDAQARLKERAQASGTYFTSCPTDAQLTGTVVYVDLATHVDCGPYNTGNWNSPGNYGILMWTRGSFKFTGSNIFYGILYAMNLDNSNRTDLVDLKGCNAILGAVLVDGAGGVDAGSCKNNIIFDERAFTAATSFGNAGVVQNSFREVQSPAF